MASRSSSSRRHLIAPTQPIVTVRTPELDQSYTFVEIVSCTFDPNRVLLRRPFFMNDDKSKYVLVGFYPAQNYQPLVEFGCAKLLPMLHMSDYVALMFEYLPTLVEAMCQNEEHRCLSDDVAFRINTTGSYRFARVTLDKQNLSIKLHELRNILYIFYMFRNQLLMYTQALSGVQSYLNALMISDNYVEPAPTASSYIIFRQLFEELKSPVYFILNKK